MLGLDMPLSSPPLNPPLGTIGEGSPPRFSWPAVSVENDLASSSTPSSSSQQQITTQSNLVPSISTETMTGSLSGTLPSRPTGSDVHSNPNVVAARATANSDPVGNRSRSSSQPGSSFSSNGAFTTHRGHRPQMSLSITMASAGPVNGLFDTGFTGNVNSVPYIDSPNSIYHPGNHAAIHSNVSTPSHQVPPLMSPTNSLVEALASNYNTPNLGQSPLQSSSEWGMSVTTASQASSSGYFGQLSEDYLLSQQQQQQQHLQNHPAFADISDESVVGDPTHHFQQLKVHSQAPSPRQQLYPSLQQLSPPGSHAMLPLPSPGIGPPPTNSVQGMMDPNHPYSLHTPSPTRTRTRSSTSSSFTFAPIGTAGSSLQDSPMVSSLHSSQVSSGDSSQGGAKIPDLSMRIKAMTLESRLRDLEAIQAASTAINRQAAAIRNSLIEGREADIPHGDLTEISSTLKSIASLDHTFIQVPRQLSLLAQTLSPTAVNSVPMNVASSDSPLSGNPHPINSSADVSKVQHSKRSAELSSVLQTNEVAPASKHLRTNELGVLGLGLPSSSTVPTTSTTVASQQSSPAQPPPMIHSHSFPNVQHQVLPSEVDQNQHSFLGPSLMAPVPTRPTSSLGVPASSSSPSGLGSSPTPVTLITPSPSTLSPSVSLSTQPQTQQQQQQQQQQPQTQPQQSHASIVPSPLAISTSRPESTSPALSLQQILASHGQFDMMTGGTMDPVALQNWSGNQPQQSLGLNMGMGMDLQNQLEFSGLTVSNAGTSAMGLARNQLGSGDSSRQHVHSQSQTLPVASSSVPTPSGRNPSSNPSSRRSSSTATTADGRPVVRLRGMSSTLSNPPNVENLMASPVSSSAGGTMTAEPAFSSLFNMQTGLPQGTAQAVGSRRSSTSPLYLDFSEQDSDDSGDEDSRMYASEMYDYRDITPGESQRRMSSGAGGEGSSNDHLGGGQVLYSEEFRQRLDGVFLRFLSAVCSDLNVTDSKGEQLHQVLMAKKMQRLDESWDFRPFKFRIQAFTNVFADRLQAEGFDDEQMPAKKIKHYLWNQSYIARFNEDGKKSKSKGNHIWNVDARKLPEGGWEFRKFSRKINGNFTNTALVGAMWQWQPRVWDPHTSASSIEAVFSSPPGSLPVWLKWKDNQLSGIPPHHVETIVIETVATFPAEPTHHPVVHRGELTVQSFIKEKPGAHLSRAPSQSGFNAASAPSSLQASPSTEYPSFPLPQPVHHTPVGFVGDNTGLTTSFLHQPNLVTSPSVLSEQTNINMNPRSMQMPPLFPLQEAERAVIQAVQEASGQPSGIGAHPVLVSESSLISNTVIAQAQAECQQRFIEVGHVSREFAEQTNADATARAIKAVAYGAELLPPSATSVDILRVGSSLMVTPSHGLAPPFQLQPQPQAQSQQTQQSQSNMYGTVGLSSNQFANLSQQLSHPDSTQFMS